MARMNWNRARRFSVHEEKYDHGTILANGRMVIQGRDMLTARADELLAKPVARQMVLDGKKEWMVLKAFVAASGLAPGGLSSDVIKRAASEIYQVPVSGNMAGDIRAISKRQRRALCRKYRKRYGLMSPAAKGRQRKAQIQSTEMSAIRDQLKPRE